LYEDDEADPGGGDRRGDFRGGDGGRDLG